MIFTFCFGFTGFTRFSIGFMLGFTGFTRFSIVLLAPASGRLPCFADARLKPALSRTEAAVCQQPRAGEAKGSTRQYSEGRLTNFLSRPCADSTATSMYNMHIMYV